MDDLTRAAIRYGTDKFGSHLYTPIYDQVLRHLRGRPIRLLEIGVGGYSNPLAGGSSLYAWAEYFPFGDIVGLDLSEKRIFPHPRINVIQGSQDDVGLLTNICNAYGPFDIVIDDGSHDPSHMIASFDVIFPLMKKEGIYIVEDTQTCFWKHAGGSPDGSGTIFDIAREIMASMHFEEARQAGQSPSSTKFAFITSSIRIHRNIIIFERGDNNYPSNHQFDMAHPNVQRVLAEIDEEAVRAPSHGNYMTRIEMQVCAGDVSAVMSLANDALAAYPRQQDLLAYILHVCERYQMHDVGKKVAQMLLDILPDDPSAIAIATRYRSMG